MFREWASDGDCKVDPAIVEDVSKYILATIKHKVEGELSDYQRREMGLFLDLDLSVLGWPEE